MQWNRNVEHGKWIKYKYIAYCLICLLESKDKKQSEQPKESERGKGSETEAKAQSANKIYQNIYTIYLWM